MLYRGIHAGEGLIVVYGVRRIGKTSFVRVGLTELDVPFLFIDLRRYAENPSLLSPQVIGKAIMDFLKKLDKLKTLRGTLHSIMEYIESMDLGIELGGIKVRRARREDRLLTSVLEEVDRWARRRGTRLVIVLDEAQELRVIPAWRRILAWSIDSLEHVTFVVTGSEIGVLNEFLRLQEAESPLFGRPRLEILLERFSRDQSIDYLQRGFSEAKLPATMEEIEDAVDTLDGIVGWLSYYGYYRTTYGLAHRDALKRLEEDAKNLLARELEKLVKHSPRRYLAILTAITRGLRTWSDIKHYAEGLVGRIPDSKYDRLLHNLVKYSFVEKTPSREYRVVDPLLPQALEELKKRYWASSS
ncbi:ATP-binding protein [Pyrodictium abyssi]|uniref:ATP-binding protein n=2 Tax=Pyrodictium abyssi TaxID=54256 RepID=A0ABM8ITM6_9CREN|nr:ATP-binding protein [Pyrodictium abyssi]